MSTVSLSSSLGSNDFLTCSIISCRHSTLRVIFGGSSLELRETEKDTDKFCSPSIVVSMFSAFTERQSNSTRLLYDMKP